MGGAQAGHLVGLLVEDRMEIARMVIQMFVLHRSWVLVLGWKVAGDKVVEALEHTGWDHRHKDRHMGWAQGHRWEPVVQRLDTTHHTLQKYWLGWLVGLPHWALDMMALEDHWGWMELMWCYHLLPKETRMEKRAEALHEGPQA